MSSKSATTTPQQARRRSMLRAAALCCLLSALCSCKLLRGVGSDFINVQGAPWTNTFKDVWRGGPDETEYGTFIKTIPDDMFSGRTVVHIYIINMRNRLARLADMMNRIRQSSLPPNWELDVHRIDPYTRQDATLAKRYAKFAVDPEDLKQDPHTSQYAAYWTRPITDGEVACFMSHAKAAHAVDAAPPSPQGTRDVFMVLEDDAMWLVEYYFHSVRVLLHEVGVVDPMWHYLSLGCSPMDDVWTNVSTHLERVGYFYQGHAYLLSRAGAHKIANPDYGNWTDNVTPFDEYLTAAARKHPRQELNALYSKPDNPLRIYSLNRGLWPDAKKPGSPRTHLSTQSMVDNFHDTEDDGGARVFSGSGDRTAMELAHDVLHENDTAKLKEAVRVVLSGSGEAGSEAFSLLGMDPAVNTTAAVCKTAYVHGAGTPEVNGKYVLMGEEHKGRKQYMQADTTRELFYAGEGWWNIQDHAGGQSPDYAALASAALTYPPPVSWESALASDKFGGIKPSPVVLVVAAEFPCLCGAPECKSQDGGAIVTAEKLHTFTVHTVTTARASLNTHALFAKVHDLAMLVSMGPWITSSKGKFKSGLRRVLAGTNAADDDVVAFADSFDAVWLCNAEQLKAVLTASGKPILLAAESQWRCRGCDEHSSGMRKLYEDRFASNTQFRYISPAAFIGRAGALRKLLRALEANNWGSSFDMDDRSALVEWALANPHMVAIDSDQQLMSDGNHRACELRHEDAKPFYHVVNKCTGKRTCGIHFAGVYNDDFVAELRAIGIMQGNVPSRHTHLEL